MNPLSTKETSLPSVDARALFRSASVNGVPTTIIAVALLVMSLLSCPPAWAGDDPSDSSLAQEFQPKIVSIVRRFCDECHSGKRTEAEIDLGACLTWADVRQHPQVWQKVDEMLESGQMPPKDAKQPSEAERALLQAWVRNYLTFEAQARAGDPGRVVLRRLSNAEYTYTLRDLTGIESLDPAREFPVDGAAGEGFTNTGNALVMSPALVTKYLDAAKEVARHAVLLPDGFSFSQHSTPSDFTNERLDRIRNFYREFTDPRGGETVNLQGIVFSTNEGGRLPVEKYLLATLSERAALSRGSKTIAAVANAYGLNAKYLDSLWQMLTEGVRDNQGTHPNTSNQPANPSFLLDGLRSRWKSAKPDDAAALANEIAQWQQALWRFTSVGHIGKVGGPKAWLEPVSPLVARQELKLKIPQPATGKEVVLYLTAGDAGDGSDHDWVVWERPRLVAPGRPDLLLRDVRTLTAELAARRERIVATAAKCLGAADEANASTQAVDLEQLARKHGVDAEALGGWLDYLGIGASGNVTLGTPLTRKMESASNYDFIQGWAGEDALSVVANSSDQAVRIPGTMKPHSIAVHPAPTRSVAVGWRSPVTTTLRISGVVQHAHPECGNGVGWALELRRGNTRQRLAMGNGRGATAIAIGPLEKVSVQVGDVVALVIDPRDGNHSCDLTAIDLTLGDGTREWDLARDLSPAIISGNPHRDGYGNADVWNFYSESVNGTPANVIPTGSLLARWQATTSTDEKTQLAMDLQGLLHSGPAVLAKDSPDILLYQQLTALGGPLLSAALRSAAGKPSAGEVTNSPWGLDPALFGRHPDGTFVEPDSLCVQAPSVLEVRLPADLVAGAELVTFGALHPKFGQEGSVQLQVLTSKPDSATGLKSIGTVATNVAGPWTSNLRGVSHATPILTMDGSAAKQRIESAFEDFREWFPAALCYTKIVPVDEVVTLTLFYREDEHLQRLMLDDRQKAQLDRLWSELHFISRDALTLVDALEQLIQFATQDANPKVFEPLLEPFNARAAAFRQLLIDTEPKHLAALLEFAGRAYRRPLTDAESNELRALYAKLRKQELPHEEAFRLTLARVLIAPAFLYRLEKPGPSVEQVPVSDSELASRLSYFLWSSQPDEELLRLAASRHLQNPEVLVAQTKRMLRDAKVRRLATEFTCQWLHIRDFDQLDEKSEKHFPTFLGVREAMYEESIRFFTDMFQNNSSVLSLLDADHTFLNEELAKHYGIPDVTGPQWRRVAGVQQYQRGGILGLATTLSTQSGASRTSPILRGSWLSEVVLGEKLPRPPKDVPVLPDTAPAGLTERQLIERHSSDEACRKCHARIDPFGFALEHFDAIGRFRERDATGLKIDAHTILPDGAEIDGLAGLRDYLLTSRRERFVRQFNRKLLGYSLGRAVQLSDEPLLAEMLRQLQGNEHQIVSAIETIVRSRQFREIRGQASAHED